MKSLRLHSEEYDAAKRNDLPFGEKQILVIEAIAGMLPSSRNRIIELERTKDNGLLAYSQDKVLSILKWIDVIDDVITVDPSSYPYKIEILPSFFNFYKIFRAKEDQEISDFKPEQIKAILDLYQDIEDEFRIRPNSKITLIEKKPIRHTPRHDALDFLTNKGIISYEIKYFSPNNIKIEILLNLARLESFKDKVQKHTNITPANKKIDLKTLTSNAKWEDITIKFIDDCKVQVKCRDKTINSNYMKMGFEDTRGQTPNKQWNLLLLLALRRGEIDWRDSVTSKTAKLGKVEQDFGHEHDEEGTAPQNKGFLIDKAPDKTKKTKQNLSQALKAIFQIDNDPFWPYKDVKAYKIRINLIPPK